MSDCLYSLKIVLVFIFECFSSFTFIWFCFTNSVLESLKTVGNLLKAILNHPGLEDKKERKGFQGI